MQIIEIRTAIEKPSLHKTHLFHATFMCRELDTFQYLAGATMHGESCPSCSVSEPFGAVTTTSNVALAA